MLVFRSSVYTSVVFSCISVLKSLDTKGEIKDLSTDYVTFISIIRNVIFYL